MATRQPRRGPLQRLPAQDFSTAEEVLKAAAYLATPENQTQRQAFENLMPHLFVLRREKGFSFKQLAGLLAACGFNLKPSSIGVYFNKIARARKDYCQQHMAEHALLMAQIRKATEGVDMSTITERVEAIMSRQRTLAAQKLDAVFGSGPTVAVAPMLESAPAPRETAKSPRAEIEIAELSSARVTPPSLPDPAGLRPLDSKPIENRAAQSPAFFAHDDSPVVPDLTRNTANSSLPHEAASPPISGVNPKPRLRCLALKAGVEPLEKRPAVADEVYLPGVLEHPAVAGLMLSLEQRLYGAALEVQNEDDGEIRLETATEKRFRVMWKRPIPMGKTMTSHCFTQIDESLFKKR